MLGNVSKNVYLFAILLQNDLLLTSVIFITIDMQIYITNLPSLELRTSLRETKNSKILKTWSPKRTAFFKSPVTFDNDLLITGDLCCSKIDPF